MKWPFVKKKVVLAPQWPREWFLIKNCPVVMASWDWGLVPYTVVLPHEVSDECL